MYYYDIRFPSDYMFNVVLHAISSTNEFGSNFDLVNPC